MSLIATVTTEEFLTDEEAIYPPEITPIDYEAASKIGSILCNREEVYQSFREPDVLDPTDLQRARIAELQRQRIDLLRELHLGDVAEVMRDPQIYFEGITLQFFEECGKDRRVYTRATYVDADTIAERAHTGTFRDNKHGVIEPEMHAQVGFRSREVDGIVSSDLTYFKVETDLQNTKPGYVYSFVSDSRGQLEISERLKDSRNAPKATPITDPIDRFTLLQALTVDMRAALGNLQHENDPRALKLLNNSVNGPRG